MGNSRDFARKRAWDRDHESTKDFASMITNTAKMNDKEFLEYKDAMKNFYSSWFVYKEVRPVTAHLLEQLFGDDASQYVSEVNRNFTEEIAVKMVKYVQLLPRKRIENHKMRRISLLSSSITEEE